ncbi:hypothetical protein CTI12_AA316760 [Artemisia annua]|uniref:eIF3a PCI domain-containing protein n=1 Tax=Artemisia annua TaxID=35608 RepID=A0A2U1N2H9_ARTAN|nr:hypothetical protein CTI12_AA316760 [Artemisia annua]
MQCILKRKGVFVRHPVSTNNVKRVKRTTNESQSLAIGSNSGSLRAGVAVVDCAHSVTTERMAHDSTQNSSRCHPTVPSQIHSDPAPDKNSFAGLPNIPLILDFQSGDICSTEGCPTSLNARVWVVTEKEIESGVHFVSLDHCYYEPIFSKTLELSTRGGSNAELIIVGQKQDALQVLHDLITSKRYRAWQKTHEKIMFKYIELCVEMRRGRFVKYGLIELRVETRTNSSWISCGSPSYSSKS